MIFALPPDLSGNPIVVVPNSKFAGLTPNGLEIGPAGTFLVTTKEKVIAQFDYFGNRLANFTRGAAGLGHQRHRWTGAPWARGAGSTSPSTTAHGSFA